MIVAFGGMWLKMIQRLGLITVFGSTALFRSLTYKFSLSKVVEQIYIIGVKTLPVVMLISLFTGMVLGIQLYLTLVKFNSEGLLGAAIALTLIRELGPVIAAIMVVGQAGSSMASEIGIMRNDEQIDALETMNIDPLSYLVGPRIIAAMICFPILTAVFDLIGIFGGYLTGVELLGLDPGSYWFRVETQVNFSDVAGGFVKAFCFGILTTVICCYKGFYANVHRGFGARGVSDATTSAVVMSSVTILVADYIITSIVL